MSSILKYSLLQYRHSQFLGEVLNIGVLVFYPSTAKLSFIKPDKLIRLRFAYPNIQEKTIKAYFRAFDDRIEKLNIQPEIFSAIESDSDFKKFIHEEFLPEDSSSLQFGEVKKSILFNSDIGIVESQLYNSFFSVFDHNSSNESRIDEFHLLAKYKSFIKDIDNDILAKAKEAKKIQFDYKISPKEGKNFKFDIAWQNGTLNLVKPISFDVCRPETIQNKSYKFYGQFLDLEDYASKNKLRFDLLIAEPKQKDLYKTFDNAIKLLQKPQHVQLVEQKKLKEYSEKTVNALSFFEN